MSEKERLELVGAGSVRVAEAARFLGLGRTKVYELMDSGRLAYLRIDGARRVPRRALERFAAESLVGG
jgi:excisionase family DNA binding protein